jgi:hypothetical protein
MEHCFMYATNLFSLWEGFENPTATRFFGRATVSPSFNAATGYANGRAQVERA